MRALQVKKNSRYYNASILSLSLILLFTSFACAKDKLKEKETSGETGSQIFVRVNLSDEKQTIHSFGASDCWSIKYIGNWKDTQKKNQIADLLFSTDTSINGNPKGIGLSLWRFNIGSGSFEQGAASDIPDEWRREECFLNEDGTYHWDKQRGQQWFLAEAKKRGVKYTLGFSLTPPTFMSKNGKAYNKSNTPNLNIQPGKMSAYADFMVKVSQYFKFDYLSPVNEPQWFWGKDRISQEGTQATNAEIASLTKLLSGKLSAKSASTKVVIGESGQWDFLYARNEDGRGDQIHQFFSNSSSNYIADLPNVNRTISGHSYFTTCPDDNMVSVRKQIAEKVKQADPGLDVWQTEFGILGNICNQYNGGPRNTGIDYGLYVAKVIHHDLTVANVTSWQWWLAVSPYNYSDALVYINDLSGKINVQGCKDEGMVLDSKQLWALGNYSRFIRPGMKRIEAGIDGVNDPVVAASSLMVSAYKDESRRKIVFVIINPEQKEREVHFTNSHGKLKFLKNSLNTYLTDSENSLKKTTISADNIKVKPRSVMTFEATYL